MVRGGAGPGEEPCVCHSEQSDRCVRRAKQSAFPSALSDGRTVGRAKCAPAALSNVHVGGCMVMFAPRSENLTCVSRCAVFFGSTARCVFWGDSVRCVCQRCTVCVFAYRFMVNLLRDIRKVKNVYTQ